MDNEVEEPDPMCECDHKESKHQLGTRKPSGDFCMGKDYNEAEKRDESCLCKKFMEEGSVLKPQAVEPEAESKSSKPWER